MYPWLGGHGSIEGQTIDIYTGPGGGSIHGWEVMAPLKGEVDDRVTGHPYGYPWLGGHGSIEG